MKQAILIYQTDAWHSRSSMDLVAIATTERKRDILIRRFLRKELHQKPSMDTLETAMREIETIGQTQCLNEECDIEIYTEYIDLNEILI